MRGTYHHGDLARALVDEAIVILGESGADGLTLKEAAKRAGVTHAAVYRHYADKHALLVAVAERGFERFSHAFGVAIGSAPKPSRAAFLHVGRAVASFALAEPVLYRVIFSGIKTWTVEELAQAPPESPFGRMLLFIKELQAARVLKKADPLRQAMAMWSITHGLASLALTGALPSDPESLATLADQVHGALLDGLGPT
jgi:AcrR family transcriptional regulator